jgi:hypothetical protein
MKKKKIFALLHLLRFLAPMTKKQLFKAAFIRNNTDN